ncbi:MAG TPA: cytochrome c [Acetobacteraceae bacterium]|nr:cytochrome c [Acetobacteraceae bacterium]
MQPESVNAMARPDRSIVPLPLAALLLSGAVLAAAMPRAARAQESGDPVAGRELAERWCKSCHMVAPTDRAISNGAPTFAGLARMPSTTSMSLRVFLHTPHPPMPDLQLSRNQIADIAAYILSLRSR